MSGEVPLVDRDAGLGGEDRSVIGPVLHLAGTQGLAENNLGHAVQLQVSTPQKG